MSNNGGLVINDDTIKDDCSGIAPWKILIADDDEQVHLVTRMVLGKMKFESRPVLFFSTHSGKETKEFLQKNNDISLVLLDVVMETQDAGLQVAHFIRHELQNNKLRIILRTGQAGLAPEQQVIDDYEINDYK